MRGEEQEWVWCASRSPVIPSWMTIAGWGWGSLGNIRPKLSSPQTPCPFPGPSYMHIHVLACRTGSPPLPLFNISCAAVCSYWYVQHLGFLGFSVKECHAFPWTVVNLSLNDRETSLTYLSSAPPPISLRTFRSLIFGQFSLTACRNTLCVLGFLLLFICLHSCIFLPKLTRCFHSLEQLWLLEEFWKAKCFQCSFPLPAKKKKYCYDFSQ